MGNTTSSSTMSNTSLVLPDLEAIHELQTISFFDGSLEQTGRSMLHVTCGHESYVSNHQLAKSCVESGDDVNGSDVYGLTALHYASFHGLLEHAQVLVQDHGAKMNLPSKNGWTAFHLACWQGHVEIVRLLLGCGANLYIQTTNEPFTPLQIALERHHSQIVWLLLRHQPSLIFGCIVEQMRSLVFQYVGNQKYLVW